MAVLASTELPRASRGGRPRDPSRDGVIRAAILRLLAEVGYGSLTMDAVASEAGVGKATIYRRWRTKHDLVVDTISDLNRAEADIPTVAVGLIVDPRQAEAIVTDGAADLVAIAREAQDDPNFALHAYRELTGGYDVYPIQAGPRLASRERLLSDLGPWTGPDPVQVA